MGNVNESLLKSTFNIKAYSREQFEYLDVLFLRLGYSVLIEFGNSLYIDNKGTFKTFDDSQTLTSSFLDGTYRGNQFKLLQDIQAKRIATSANYDAIFGRISNYTWNFLPDGSYDINLVIMSYGDIIEALKSNTAAEDTGGEESAVVTEAKVSQQIENPLFLTDSPFLAGFLPDFLTNKTKAFSRIIINDTLSIIDEDSIFLNKNTKYVDRIITTKKPLDLMFDQYDYRFIYKDSLLESRLMFVNGDSIPYFESKYSYTQNNLSKIEMYFKPDNRLIFETSS